MEGKQKNPEEWSTLKITGAIFELLGFLLVIVVVLLEFERNPGLLGTIGLLLLAGNVLFFVGLILSHLPQEKK